jgi:hypothetical protein
MLLLFIPMAPQKYYQKEPELQKLLLLLRTQQKISAVKDSLLLTFYVQSLTVMVWVL